MFAYQEEGFDPMEIGVAGLNVVKINAAQNEPMEIKTAQIDSSCKF